MRRPCNARHVDRSNKPLCHSPGRFLTPPREQAPPPGWTPEFDRYEEFQALSDISLFSKSAQIND